jgi:GAF domain-containing protein
MIEVLKWLGRIVAILPALEKFWNAVQSADEANMDLTGEQIAAALELMRSVKRQQAREELGG